MDVHYQYAPQSHFIHWTEKDQFVGRDVLCTEPPERLDQDFDFYGPSNALDRYLQEPQPRPLFTMECNPYQEDMTLQAHPDVALAPMGCAVGYSGVHDSHRSHSPIYSGLASSYVSSNQSDRRDTPLSSPSISEDPYSPVNSIVGMPYPCGSLYSHHGPVVGSCVALHDVQKHADEQTEKLELEDESMMYPYSAFAVSVSEGYQPMVYGGSIVIESTNEGENINLALETKIEQSHPASPNLRRRKTHPPRSVPSPVVSARITKRTHGRRAPTSNVRVKNEAVNNSANRAFPCPLAAYGCQSTFATKNEWKRHVNTQHMRLGFWRCDQCPDVERKPNDFNRKDLFIQHVRRMHPVQGRPNEKKASAKASPRDSKDNAEDQLLQTASKRCYRQTRSPPDLSGCLFCDDQFHGPTTWDDRMEHIGRHMETAKKENLPPVDSQDWRIDEALQEWMLDQRILVQQGGSLVLAEPKA